MAGKTKYFSHVKPRLDDIRRWKAGGASDVQICKILGVGKSALYLYKRQYRECMEAFAGGIDELKADLKSKLYDIAVGGKPYFEETTSYGLDDQGSQIIVAQKKTQKFTQPNVYALNLLLSNLDPEWVNNRKLMTLKEREIALQEKKENDKW